jgi:hypothetical protein
MIKLLLENFKKYLLLELRLEEVLPRLDSQKFINSSKYHGVAPEKAKKLILDTVPDDVEDSEKANYLNWRIKQFMVNGAIKGPTPKSVEIFYIIKANNLDKLLTKNDINSFESVEEFSNMMNGAEKEYLNHAKKKKESTVDEKDINKIYENEDWEVYIPESKAASCRLGTGTNWCTAARGKRNMYSEYHSKESPLIIFISKKISNTKYQFNYRASQFMDKKDTPIRSSLLFFKLNEIVKNLTEALPDTVISAAKKFDLKELPDGGYTTSEFSETRYYNKKGKLHRDGDQPAVVLGNVETRWYQNGKLHRDGDQPALIMSSGGKEWWVKGERHRDGDQPAVIKENGTKKWYQNGLLHRENDQPAVIEPNGNKEWWVRGNRHRDGNRPSVIASHGVKMWHKNGVYIRDNVKLPI